jgi:hypothetical protein
MDKKCARRGDVLAREYTFINMVPYARRIEIGKTKSGRSFALQVENRIYERTAKDAKAKFGKAADIQFGYRESVGAYSLKQDQVSRYFIGGRIYHAPTIRKDRAKGTAVSTPAIIVRLKKS